MKRFIIFITFLVMVISLVPATDFPSTEITISFTGNLTNLSEMQDVSIPSPADNEVLTFESATSKWVSASVGALVDTNETTRVNAMVGTNCGVGNYSYGFNASGVILCRADSTGGSAVAGDGVYLYNASGVMSLNTTLAGTNLSVNSSDFWDNYDIPNATWFSNLGGALSINTTGITNLCVNIDGDNATGNFNFTSGYFHSDTYRATSMDFSFTDDGSNFYLNLPDITGNDYFEIATDGGFFQLYNNPNAGNDYLLASITETQGADTELNFYEGGTGHNRFWDSGSMRIGGGASRLCSNLTTDVDCDTPLTGADLVVQDDIWLGGAVLSNNWTNVTITESQVSDLGSYVNESGDTMTGQLNMSYNNITDISYDIKCYNSTLCWQSYVNASGYYIIEEV